MNGELKRLFQDTIVLPKRIFRHYLPCGTSAGACLGYACVNYHALLGHRRTQFQLVKELKEYPKETEVVCY